MHFLTTSVSNMFSNVEICYCLFAKSCPNLLQPLDCSPPGSSLHGISQARILDWVAISFSRGSSPLRNKTSIFWVSGRFFITKPPVKSNIEILSSYKYIGFFCLFQVEEALEAVKNATNEQDLANRFKEFGKEMVKLNYVAARRQQVGKILEI